MSELAREFEAALVVGEEKAVAEAKRWNRIGYAVLAGTFGVVLNRMRSGDMTLLFL